MITTFSISAPRAPRRSRWKAAIIGAALVALTLLGGCSALKLTYSNGAQLTWWWLDGYLDVPGARSPQVKAAIGRWFDWHRATQIGPTAALLEQTADEVLQPASPDLVCRWERRARELAAPAVDRALAEAAALLPLLEPAQIRHLEQRLAKNRDEMRAEMVQPDAAERRAAQTKRAVERFERLYGSLGEAQRRVIAAGVAASPWDGEAWLAERERRHRDVVQTLTRLVAERADRDTALAALRTLVERQESSPDPGYRALQQRLDGYGCQFGAQVHNATTPAQRQAARERLRGWAADLRAVGARPANGNGAEVSLAR